MQTCCTYQVLPDDDSATITLLEEAEKLEAYSEQIHTLLVDVTKQQDADRAIQDVVAQKGRIDFVFNNAGIGALCHWRRHDRTLEVYH